MVSSVTSMWPSLFEKQKKRTSVPQPFSAYVGGGDNDGWRTARPLKKSPQLWESPSPPADGPLPADSDDPAKAPTEDAQNAQADSATADTNPQQTAQDSTQTKAPNSQSHEPDNIQIKGCFTSLHVLSWNIDFSVPEEVPRMETALSHLHAVTQEIPDSAAVVIFLQEMTWRKLHVIRQAPWIRERFYMTDESSSFWISSYGTTILVDRRLVIAGEGVHRLRLISEFGRDGLFVDLLVRPLQRPGDQEEEVQDKILRLCNVHLESLASNPPRRPAQFAAISPLLQPSSNIHAAIMAGDTNANRPYDSTLPAENDLADTFISLGGSEGAEDGHTWGYQSGRTRFPPTRLDKILFTGNIEAAKLDRLGMGIMVEDVGARMRLENIGEEEYVTDHYGLWGQFEIRGDVGLVNAKEAWRLCCAPKECACARPGAFDPAYGLIQ